MDTHGYTGGGAINEDQRSAANDTESLWDGTYRCPACSQPFLYDGTIIPIACDCGCIFKIMQDYEDEGE